MDEKTHKTQPSTYHVSWDEYGEGNPETMPSFSRS